MLEGFLIIWILLSYHDSLPILRTNGYTRIASKALSLEELVIYVQIRIRTIELVADFQEVGRDG